MADPSFGRFVVVRKTLPEEDTPKTTPITPGRYSYHAFVTVIQIGVRTAIPARARP
jgi:hypothetical protein